MGWECDLLAALMTGWPPLHQPSAEVFSVSQQSVTYRHAGSMADFLCRLSLRNLSDGRSHLEYFFAYRVAPAIAVRRAVPRRSHSTPPAITSRMEMNWVPLMAPPNITPRPGSSRMNSRK